MNYTKVIKDFKNGKIDPKKWTLVMDNDGGYWSRTEQSGDELNTVNVEREYEYMKKAYGEPDGYRDIVDVLLAAGVNTEWC